MNKKTEDDSSPRKGRIAFFDIETSPIISYNWGIYEQDAIEVIEDWTIIAFAFKLEGQKKVYSYTLEDFPLYKTDPKNDREVVKKLWELFNVADVLVAHNGDQFDIPKANARFIIHNLPPPAPHKQIDTKKLAKSRFKFTSNKLSDLAKYLNVSLKGETGGFSLWKGCMAGDKKAWKKMREYNEQDVVVLEEIYLKLRPWAKTVPNMKVYSEASEGCPRCCSKNVQRRGWVYTSNGKRPRSHCLDCGAWSCGKQVKMLMNQT